MQYVAATYKISFANLLTRSSLALDTNRCEGQACGSGKPGLAMAPNGPSSSICCSRFRGAICCTDRRQSQGNQDFPFSPEIPQGKPFRPLNPRLLILADKSYQRSSGWGRRAFVKLFKILASIHDTQPIVKLWSAFRSFHQLRLSASTQRCLCIIHKSSCHRRLWAST